jgi:hypothetical protein
LRPLYPILKIPLLMLLILMIHSAIKSQIYYSLNGEFGFSKFGMEGFHTPLEPLILIDTRVGYIHKRQYQNKFSLQFGLRPELYKSYKSIKFLAKGAYNVSHEQYKCAINLTKRKNIYTGTMQDISYDLFILQPDITFFFIPKMPLTMSTGYINQIIKRKLSASRKYKLDLLFFNVTLYKFIDEYYKIYSGIYTERFSYNNIINSSNNKRSGWRIGPVLGFNYLKRYTIHINYRLLKIMPKLYEFPLYEHYVQFLYGKIIRSTWSIFFLIDYYIRHFEKNNNTLNDSNLLFPLLNNENRIFLKLAKDIKKNLMIYIKIGYYNEDLYNINYSLSGWKVLIGMGLKK